jgi:hypothetical protein
MSEKKLEKKKPLPIIVEEETSKGDIPKGLNLYLISFKWIKRKFVNLNDGSEVKIKFWTRGGNVILSPVLRAGRHVVVHEKVPKYILDAEGKVLQKKMVSKTRIIGKEFGYKALASILSAIYPSSIEEVKRLVKEAVDKNLKHPKLVLKSDLVPTSPDKYEKMGFENSWVCIADYPSSDEIQVNVNKVLKAQGSPLRARFGLKWKLAE